MKNTRKIIKKIIKKKKTTRKKLYKSKGGGKLIYVKNVDTNDICPICHETFSSTPHLKIYETNCKHMFHNDCIINVCERIGSKSCPICRTSLGNQCDQIDDFKYNADWVNVKLVNKNRKCKICEKKFKNTPTSAIYRTSCNHFFHNNCLLDYCDMNDDEGNTPCPICEESLELSCVDVWAFKNQELTTGLYDPEIIDIYNSQGRDVYPQFNETNIHENYLHEDEIEEILDNFNLTDDKKEKLRSYLKKLTYKHNYQHFWGEKPTTLYGQAENRVIHWYKDDGTIENMSNFFE